MKKINKKFGKNVGNNAQIRQKKIEQLEDDIHTRERSFRRRQIKIRTLC